jgi:hypothetical protein
VLPPPPPLLPVLPLPPPLPLLLLLPTKRGASALESWLPLEPGT